MNIKGQVEKAREKTRLSSDVTFNLRLFVENIVQVMNPPRDITLEFKELSQEMELTRRQLITQLTELESFMPSFPIEGEVMQDVA